MDVCLMTLVVMKHKAADQHGNYFNVFLPVFLRRFESFVSRFCALFYVRRNQLVVFCLWMLSSIENTRRIESWWNTISERWRNCGLYIPLSRSVRDNLWQIFSLGVAFTSYHIKTHTVRNIDYVWYNRHRNRLSAISEEGKRKNSEAQSKYRRKRRQRPEIGFWNIIIGTDDVTHEESNWTNYVETTR